MIPTLLLSAILAQAPAPAAYVDKYANVNGLRLHYLDWGSPEKPPMILLHGIARHAHTFDHLAPHFARDFHVLAIDMRGHGDSDWDPEGDYLVEDHVKDLEDLVAQLRLQRITLLGNSTGGRVAQVFAGLHPELVAKLIVEDVGPERPEDIASGFARRVKQEADGWASEDGARGAADNGKPGRRGDVDSHLRALRRQARAATAGWCGSAIPIWCKGFLPTELWRYVSRITSPTIYILGGKSTIVPADTQRRLKETLPQLRDRRHARARPLPRRREPRPSSSPSSTDF